MLLTAVGLMALGVAVGTYGTLIGAGGGFVLVPILLLLYPHEEPEVIASISLAVVFFNTLSGSIAYGRMRRIDYRGGLLFGAATVPGAVLGAVTTTIVPRHLFELICAVLMILGAAFLMWRPLGNGARSPDGQAGRGVRRTLTDTEGNVYDFTYRRWVGVVLSLGVGYLSGLLGIGGGIIHVPALVHLLNFPVHVATATSHFVLSIMAFSGTVTHIATGAFHHGVRRSLFLAVGVVAGAQLGAVLSNRVGGPWIVRSLALALAFVGLRLIWMAL